MFKVSEGQGRKHEHKLIQY